MLHTHDTQPTHPLGKLTRKNIDVDDVVLPGLRANDDVDSVRGHLHLVGQLLDQAGYDGRVYGYALFVVVATVQLLTKRLLVLTF